MQEKQEKIDIEMQKRMDTGVAMTSAIGWAQDQWDKELNKSYAKCLKVLKPKEAVLLRDSQRAWIRFRDSETKLIAAQMQADPNLTGSSGNPGRLGATMKIMQITRTRARQMRDYADPPSNGE